jgi:hypothetical protein
MGLRGLGEEVSGMGMTEHQSGRSENGTQSSCIYRQEIDFTFHLHNPALFIHYNPILSSPISPGDCIVSRYEIHAFRY